MLILLTSLEASLWRHADRQLYMVQAAVDPELCGQGIINFDLGVVAASSLASVTRFGSVRKRLSREPNEVC
jgi:hypothetical protein